MTSTVETKAEAVKRRRTDAGEWVDNTVEALAETLGKRFTLTDLPSDVVKYKLMSLLTVSESAQVFQKGYLMLPAAVSAAKHAMKSPVEFFVPAHVIREHLNRTTNPMALIGCWQRSDVGADVRVLRFSPDVDVKLDVDDLKSLLHCFPKADSITLGSSCLLVDILAYLETRPVPLAHLRLTSLVDFLSASRRETLGAMRGLLRMAPQLLSLHLHHSLWGGDVQQAAQLVDVLSKRLESLRLSLRRAPSVEMLQALFKRCPMLVDLGLHDQGSDTDSVPLIGKFAKALEGDNRQWRHFRYHMDRAACEPMSTADLAAIAGEHLETLDLQGVDVQGVDFKTVLSKCRELQVLNDSRSTRNNKADEAMLLALYSSPVAGTVVRLSDDLRSAIPWTAAKILQHHTQLPRLAAVDMLSSEMSGELLATLSQADHRNALKTLTLSSDDATPTAFSSAAVARVLLNSTRWTEVESLIALDQPLPTTVLTHLTDKCPDLVRWRVPALFEGLTGARLLAWMESMRHGRELVIGETDIAEAKLVADSDIEGRHLGVRSKRPANVVLNGMILTRLTADDIYALTRRNEAQHITCIVPRQVAEEYERRFGHVQGRFRLYGEYSAMNRFPISQHPADGPRCYVLRV